MLLGSANPSQTLALSLLRMMADEGISRDPDTWDLLGDETLKAVFGVYGWVAFCSRSPGVWEEMKRLAPLLENWP